MQGGLDGVGRPQDVQAHLIDLGQLPGQGGEAPALLLPPRDGLISPLLPHAAQEFGQLRLCRLPVPPDLDALPLLLGRRIAHRIQDRLIFHPVLPSVPGSAGTHM